MEQNKNLDAPFKPAPAQSAAARARLLKPWDPWTAETLSDTMRSLGISFDDLDKSDRDELARLKLLPPPSVVSQIIDRSSLPPSSSLTHVKDEAGPAPLSKLVESDADHMKSSIAFEMDKTSDQASFLGWYPAGNATLKYPNRDGTLSSVDKINLDLIRARCPLLAAAFEYSRSGPRLYLETVNSSTALPFLQFLYTGDYFIKGNVGDAIANEEHVPTSLLSHLQLFHVGSIYELPELKKQAYLNILRQCEFGCCSPAKPVDLCAAIRFLYEDVRDREEVADAIVNYCVSRFLDHKLGEDEKFQTLMYGIRQFHQALCKNSMSREFENDTAAAIIQMPFEPCLPKIVDVDLYKEMKRYEEEMKVAAAAPTTTTTSDSTLTMAIRTAAKQKDAVSTLTMAIRAAAKQEDAVAPKPEELSEDEGFSLVKKKRASLSAGSESDFEVVLKPAETEELSDASSDEGKATTLVEKPAMQKTQTPTPTPATAVSLPLRIPAATAVAEVWEDVAVESDSDSDSEWAMV